MCIPMCVSADRQGAFGKLSTRLFDCGSLASVARRRTLSCKLVGTCGVRKLVTRIREQNGESPGDLQPRKKRLVDLPPRMCRKKIKSKET